MQPLAVLAIEIILCAYFLRQTEAGLKMFGLVNLLLVITTGEAMANYGFGISNIGNIYYAFGLQTILLIYFLYGHTIAAKMVRHSCVATIGFIAIRGASLFLGAVNADAPIVSCYQLVYSSGIRFFLAAVIGMTFSAGLMVLLIDRFDGSRLVRALVAITIAELVDSVLFFGVAFAFDEVSALREYFAVGFIVKLALHFATLPVLFWIADRRK